jgi:hypothetical protein
MSVGEAGVLDATKLNFRGAAGSQGNSAGSQLLLLFVVLVPLPSSFGQNPNNRDNPSVQLMVVVQSMEEAQSDISNFLVTLHGNIGSGLLQVPMRVRGWWLMSTSLRQGDMRSIDDLAFQC